MSAALSGGDSTLVAHRAAAALWGLDRFEEPVVEISVKAGRRIPGAVVHRRRPCDDPPVAVIAGLRVTGIERTLLDVAVVARGRVAAALDDALRRGLTTLEDVARLLASLGPRGRTGSRALAGLVAVRDGRDANLESRLEADFLALLRAHDLPLPTPQYLVLDGDGHVG